MNGPPRLGSRNLAGRETARSPVMHPRPARRGGQVGRDGQAEASATGTGADRDGDRGDALRILLTSRHRFPAGGREGTGTRANPRTTGGAAIIHDLLAKGLAELGHEVSYHLEYGHDGPAPEGVRFVDAPPAEVEHPPLLQ